MNILARSIAITAISFMIAMTGTIQCMAGPTAQVDAALNLLDATDFDNRLKTTFNLTRIGVPAFDVIYEKMAQTPDFQAMRNRATEQIPAIRAQLSEIYATKLSESELTTLTEFFRTPTGRKYVTLLPELQINESKIVLQTLLKSDPKAGEQLEALKRQQEKTDAARTDLEKRAKNNDREAMYQLGICYCSSYGVGIDRKAMLEKCFEWKKRAAEAGLREAQFDIGFSYIDGRYGNGKSGKEMARWMKLAADQGHSSAQFYVGSAYAGNTRAFGNQPTGVEADGKEAVRWLAKAADAGSMGAIMDLASIYMEGRLVERDASKAIHWYSQAAAKRNTFAMRKLGEIYESGIEGEPNLQEAMKWYKQAAGVQPR